MQDLDCEARSIRSNSRSQDQSSHSSTDNSRLNILPRLFKIQNKDNNNENSIISNNSISLNNFTISNSLSIDTNDDNKRKISKKTNSFLRLNKINPVDENNDNFSSLINITTKVSDPILEQSSTIGYINSVQSSFLTLKKLTVMVVDDSAMNRKIVRRTLESYHSANKLNGCQVVIEEADDGLTAIEKYKAITSDNNGSVDLIVLGKSFS
jgi:CheY-like chemotaxis protein